jgi:hypothetical protein
VSHLYESLGWSIIPVDADTKGSLIPWRRYQLKAADLEQMLRWSAQFPQAGIAVVTGRVSGIVVLDADGPLGAAEALKRGIPKTPMAATPSGGFHAYFAHPGFDFRNSTKLGESKKIDVRGDAGYVLAPHTKRSDGRRYTWMQHPDKTKLATAPAWFIALLKASPPKGPPIRGPLVGPISSDESVNSTLASLPGKLRELILDGHDLERFPSRSECDHFVLIQLLARGVSTDEIEAIFQNHAIGEKVREEGSHYFERTLHFASQKVKHVQVRYADLNTYDGGGQRLHLGLVDGGSGQLIRCGVTVPSNGQSALFLRWAHLFEACGLPVPIGRQVNEHIKKLIGKQMRIEYSESRDNAVGAFHRVVTL